MTNDKAVAAEFTPVFLLNKPTFVGSHEVPRAIFEATAGRKGKLAWLARHNNVTVVCYTGHVVLVKAPTAVAKNLTKAGFDVYKAPKEADTWFVLTDRTGGVAV